MSSDPWSASAFEARYRADPDPWDFAGSPYEQARYDAILQSFPNARYERAYEPGCSVGALTTRLATRCGHLYAVDISPTAIDNARDRCRANRNVDLAVGSVAGAPPSDLDLVVFSEIGYYFRVSELDLIIGRVAAALGPFGDLVACHWLGESADHRLHGREVHERLHRVLRNGFTPVEHVEDPGFVIDVWRRS